MYKTSLLSTGPRCQKQIQRRRSFTAGVGVVPPNQSRPQHKYNVASLKKKKKVFHKIDTETDLRNIFDLLCVDSNIKVLWTSLVFLKSHIYWQFMCEHKLQMDTGLLGTVNRFFPGGNFSNKQRKTSFK